MGGAVERKKIKLISFGLIYSLIKIEFKKYAVI